MCNKDKGEFWKKIWSIGVVQKRNRIPWEVVNDGMVSKEPNMVLEKWYGSFKDLLNPTSTKIENVDALGEQQESIHTGLENSISLLEINKVLSHMKIGKASGIDEIPLEAMRNDVLKCFMLKLFNLCFEKQVFPSSWHKIIINPVPK